MFAFWLVAISVIIVAEGALSFLGLGIPAPQPSWGGMIADGREALDVAPHTALIPAAVMFAHRAVAQFPGRHGAQHGRSAQVGAMSGDAAVCRCATRAWASPRRAAAARRRRRVVRPAGRPHARHRGRIGVGQVGAGALADRPGGRRRRGAEVGGAGAARRRGPARACPTTGMRARARPRHRHRLPGPDDLAQSGDEDRPPDRRGPAAQPRARRRRRGPARGRTAGRGRHSRGRSGGPASIRTKCRAACASAWRSPSPSPASPSC